MGDHRRAGVDVERHDDGAPTSPTPTIGQANVRALVMLMYSAFTLAGFACFFFPSRAVTSHVDPTYTYVWAGFFFFGGLASLIGAISQGWWGEMIGLPLIASASLLYGTAVLVQYSDPNRRDGAFLFVGALLIAQGLSLAERWVARWRLLRVAQRISREAE